MFFNAHAYADPNVIFKKDFLLDLGFKTKTESISSDKPNPVFFSQPDPDLQPCFYLNVVPGKRMSRLERIRGKNRFTSGHAVHIHLPQSGSERPRYL